MRALIDKANFKDARCSISQPPEAELTQPLEQVYSPLIPAMLRPAVRLVSQRLGWTIGYR